MAWKGKRKSTVVTHADFYAINGIKINLEKLKRKIYVVPIRINFLNIHNSTRIFQVLYYFAPHLIFTSSIRSHLLIFLRFVDKWFACAKAQLFCTVVDFRKIYKNSDDLVGLFNVQLFVKSIFLVKIKFPVNTRESENVAPKTIRFNVTV